MNATPTDASPFHLQVGDKDLDFRDITVPQGRYTGSGLLAAAGYHPVVEHLLFDFPSGNGLREVRPDQEIELSPDAGNRYLVFRNDRSFRAELNDRVFEWGDKKISGRVLERLAGVNPATHRVYLDVPGTDDRHLGEDEEVNLAASGVERFYTRPKLITLIINGRRREVPKGKYSYAELVRLAFPDAVFAENIVYTVSYKHGPASHPEGSVVDGQTIRVRDEEVINVIRSDRS